LTTNRSSKKTPEEVIAAIQLEIKVEQSKSVSAIIKIGRLLLDAQNKVARGCWEDCSKDLTGRSIGGSPTIISASSRSNALRSLMAWMSNL
jgi:hypothetical protein